MMPGALAFHSERDLLAFALDQAAATGSVLEFGVYKGGSARFIARRIGSGRIMHGFDSFEGLPETWSGGGMMAGTFSMGGKLPKVPSNCHLHKGRFDQSLPGWVGAHPEPVAFLHVDCDLYVSTRSVFEALGEQLGVGCIIVFDEYFNYPNWRLHEYKAFQEMIAGRAIGYEYIGYSQGQVAVRLTEPGTGALSA